MMSSSALTAARVVSFGGCVLAHNRLQSLVCANKAPVPVRERCDADRRSNSHASDPKMSVALHVEFRKKQNAHVLCRSIVAFWIDPRGMRGDFVSPFNDVSKLLLQILGRRKCFHENANK